MICWVGGSSAGGATGQQSEGLLLGEHERDVKRGRAPQARDRRTRSRRRRKKQAEGVSIGPRKGEKGKAGRLKRFSTVALDQEGRARSNINISGVRKGLGKVGADGLQYCTSYA